jgi:hypothetical protein
MRISSLDLSNATAVIYMSQSSDGTATFGAQGRNTELANLVMDALEVSEGQVELDKILCAGLYAYCLREGKNFDELVSLTKKSVSIFNPE